MLGRPSYLGVTRLIIAIATVIAALALPACSGGESAPSLEVGIISTDLGVGTNRLVFYLLEDGKHPVKVDQVDVSVYYLPGDWAAIYIARFRQWPLESVGVYTTNLSFDRAGQWGLWVAVTGPDGDAREAHGTFQVKEQSDTPAIGSPAPLSRNKTAGDVSDLNELTTSDPPDPDLYTMTIADAVAGGKPLVVVFATPAFCQTATCGPQVEQISDLKDRYGDRANFIHVEVWDNPLEIREHGDLSNAKAAPAVEEWGLPTEPWTFVVDSRGLIAAKFEAFTTVQEIEEALQKVLQ